MQEPHSSILSQAVTALAALLLVLLLLAPFLWWGASLLGVKLSCPVW